MTPSIELQSSVKTDHRGHVVLGDSLGELLLGDVEVVNVSGMMFAGIRKSGFGRWVRSKH